MIGQALRRLDVLLRLDAARVRAAAPRAEWHPNGWFVSDEQVDRLLSDASADTTAPPSAIGRAAADAALEADPAWRRLIDAFELGPFERDLVLLTLAPELDLRYETVVGYLNDDLTRVRPTRAMALRALGADLHDRAALDEGAPLLREGILRVLDERRGGWLASQLALTPTALRHLLALPPGDAELVRRPPRQVTAATATLRDFVTGVAALASTTPEVPIAVTVDAAAPDRNDLVDLLAARLGVAALELTTATPTLVARAMLARRLSGCLLAAGPTSAVLAPLFDTPGIVVTTADDLPASVRTVHWPRHIPSAPERRRRWRSALAATGLKVRPTELDRLAERFALDNGQIDRAARQATDAHALGGATGTPGRLAMAAARGATSAALRELTISLPTDCGWADLVLPGATASRLREVAGALRSAELVYRTWDFGTRTGARTAINILFAGPSGTGKTLAARVLAGELGVELFAIDLSGVVSKYIGETEKNLDRVFAAAEGSNALLLFDEADALFGKRSEVKDAHDRYANIEVAYLLQKLEQHDGAVILATNLGPNLDTAFSRRMHYVVEFPLPAAALRERLWRATFPPAAPLAADVDMRWLARQFPLSGGEIRTVALDAAFSAAGNGCVITMTQIVRAMARQLAKNGRTASALEFQHYHGLLGSQP